MRPRAGEKGCNQRLSFAAEKPQPRLHCSQQFSTVALTTSSGAIAERYAYSAYGAPTVCNASGTDIGSSAKDNRITYTGREWDDELVLYHFRARLYDAGVGRFLGRDPLQYEGSPFSLSQFLDSSPLHGFDPTGLANGRPYRPRPRHPSGIKRCVFVFRPFTYAQFGGQGLPSDGTYVEENADPLLIRNIIQAWGCCEVLLLGHQGAPDYVGGITEEFPKGTKTPILPSLDESLEKEIREAMEWNKCKGCKLYFYTCGGGDQVKQKKARERMAELTGCDIYATTGEARPIDPLHLPPKKDYYCTLDPDKWGKETIGCKAIPFPLVEYPSKDPLK
jgi:RHS repeat-associated protein